MFALEQLGDFVGVAQGSPQPLLILPSIGLGVGAQSPHDEGEDIVVFEGDAGDGRAVETAHDDAQLIGLDGLPEHLLPQCHVF